MKVKVTISIEVTGAPGDRISQYPTAITFEHERHAGTIPPHYGDTVQTALREALERALKGTEPYTVDAFLGGAS